MSNNILTVQAAKDRIKIALRELYRIKRAAKFNNAEQLVSVQRSINALKAEHAELSGIGPDTRYSIVTDGFKEAKSDLQIIIDERQALIETMKRAKKASEAVQKVLGLYD